MSGDYKEILLAMIGERPPPAPVPEEEDAGEPELEEVEEEHIEVWIDFVLFLCILKQYWSTGNSHILHCK